MSLEVLAAESTYALLKRDDGDCVVVVVDPKGLTILPDNINEDLRGRRATSFDVTSESFEKALASLYPPGSGMGEERAWRRFRELVAEDAEFAESMAGGQKPTARASGCVPAVDLSLVAANLRAALRGFEEASRSLALAMANLQCALALIGRVIEDMNRGRKR